MLHRVFLLALLLLAGFASPAQPPTGRAVPRLAPSFFTTYTYLTYSILDRGTSPTPLPAKGVGGTLTLQPNGTYQKRLTLSANGGTMPFSQDGRFTFSGNRIRFTYSAKNGQPRTDEGTFALRNGLLTLTMQGYPAGNQSIYTLRQQ